MTRRQGVPDPSIRAQDCRRSADGRRRLGTHAALRGPAARLVAEPVRAAAQLLRTGRGAIVWAPFPAIPTIQGGEPPMRFTRAVLLVAAVLLLGAAGPAMAQTFIFGGQGEPVQFDPAVITDGISAKITRQVFDTLYEFKPGTTTGPAGARREGRGLGRRQDLDARAPQEREVPRRRAVRREGRRLELRALDEHQESAAREPAQGGPDLRVLRGPVRRLRRQVGHREGRGDRQPHREVHAPAAPGAVPPEHRHVPLRHRQPEGRREVGHGVREAPGGDGRLQVRRVEAEPGGRARGQRATTGGRRPASSGPSSATSRTTPSGWPRSRPARCTGSRGSTPTT